MTGRVLDLPKLRLYEDGRIWDYTLAKTKSGINYYVAPDYKRKYHATTLMQDFLYLPISYSAFKYDRSHYFYGFRYLTAIPNVITIENIPFLGVPKTSYFDIGFEVARVRYFIEDDHDFDVAIDFMGDSLFPTRIVSLSIRCGNNASEIADYFVQNLIDEHCNWYENREI